MTCPECPHERHPDRCWEVVEKWTVFGNVKMLCPCSEFYGYRDLDGCDADESLPAGHGVVDRWEEEKEQHEAATLERG